MSTSEVTRVTYDDQPIEGVADIYGAHYGDYLFDPQNDSEATDRLINAREKWRDQGKTVVLTSGVYDLLHHNHKGYLLHTKLSGAATHYANHHGQNTAKDWNSLDEHDKHVFTIECMASDVLRLIVSVDGDNSVASRKGGKGGAARPITGWITRARSVADVTYPLSKYSTWERKPVANAVTMHGPEDFEDSSTHHSLIKLATALQPDVWTVFEESDDILSTAPFVPELGSVALTCIAMGEDSRYFTDPVIGNFSTTAILIRAQGEL